MKKAKVATKTKRKAVGRPSRDSRRDPRVVSAFYSMHPDIESIKAAARVRYPAATEEQIAELAAATEANRPKGSPNLTVMAGGKA